MADNAVPPPPGWYDDQTGTRTLRWWDGRGWTENTAPMQDPATPPAQPAPASVAVEQEPTPPTTPDASSSLSEEVQVRPDDVDEEPLEEAPGSISAGSRGKSVTLAGDTVTIVFDGAAVPSVLKEKSPIVIPLVSIEQVRYVPAGTWKVGSMSFHLTGRPIPTGIDLEGTTVSIASGRGAAMRKRWDRLAGALREAIPAAVPKVPYVAPSREVALTSAPAGTDQKSAKERAKQIARLNKTYADRWNTWNSQVAAMEAVVALAKSAHPDSDSSDIVLKAGEQHWLTTSGGLVDEVPGARTWVSGSRGISVPIGKIGGSSIRYYAGSSKGHSVQAPPHDAIIDSGRIVITDQRIVFIGAKQTRECLFSKLVAYDHEGAGNTTVSVSNRQKPTRFHYSDSNRFQINFEFAIAAFRGVEPDVVQQLQNAVDRLHEQEPKLIES